MYFAPHCADLHWLRHVLFDATVQIFGQVAVQTSAPLEARVMVARTLCDLQARSPGSMGPLLAQLSPEQQAALQQLVGAAS